ncbi:aries arylalkylamine N-acetyltransferase [Histoplasma capsulatum H143]|uniref:Aries arylalkylamine N-acetyltransferase n=1 Tax=Ajellomyces capsulatus (strain H143) TaxID=544712 RepID=C6H343_AJECH|nr:aries arylalkylamine N-acetyltransferase [Histoplasma capsulatum H143]
MTVSFLIVSSAEHIYLVPTGFALCLYWGNQSGRSSSKGWPRHLSSIAPSLVSSRQIKYFAFLFSHCFLSLSFYFYLPCSYTIYLSLLVLLGGCCVRFFF